MAKFNTMPEAYVVVEKWKSRSRHAVNGFAYGAWSKFFLDMASAEKELKRLSNLPVFTEVDKGELFIMTVEIAIV